MAATFDPTLPTKRDEARLWLGDYHTSAVAGAVPNAFLQDETIDAKLALYPYPEAVAQLASALISKYANAPDTYEEGHSLRLEWKNRLAAWRTVVDEARASNVSPTLVYRPGIAVGQIQSPLDTAKKYGSKTGFRSN